MASVRTEIDVDSIEIVYAPRDIYMRENGEPFAYGGVIGRHAIDAKYLPKEILDPLISILTEIENRDNRDKQTA